MTPSAITITLPWPPAALSPNAGKASMWPGVTARKEYRELAGWGWTQRKQLAVVRLWPLELPLYAPVVADITFIFTRKRNWDEDNHLAMLKPVWDGAKDAGVIVDDNADVFSIGEVTFVRGTERGVTVTLKARAR